ncbi:hypothetical protein [Accumulibacter sp.]|uniref:hypothetical protein n=1 Tax=Accumulibacter sp. TaxID=2053492 RepID=UPI0025FF93AE|nr:hypothetical protein [Accumulibacter sp.]MCM8627601.1 hypothetical protein [Accumulibacter sp.]
MVQVDFPAPDEDMLEGLGVSLGYAIRHSTWRVWLATGDRVTVESQGHRVREVWPVADGSEFRATLTRIT